MSKFKWYVITLLIPGILFNCTPKNTDGQNSVEDGRNMFGHYIPRGLTKTTENLSPGYVMFQVPNSASTYLINRKGEVVHEWKGNYDGMQAYLMDDGSIVHGAIDPDYPTFLGAGAHGRIQKITWDSKMLWDFEYATKEQIVHHDFAVMPNGNILAIVYEVTPYEDVLAKGRKPELIHKYGPWLEKIIEIAPEGNSSGNIVWEWRILDHLIQDHDATKANYGNSGEHPELLDFKLGKTAPQPIHQDTLDMMKASGQGHRNLTAHNRGSDIYHFNALNYNAELDQIVFSSPVLSEIFIIDHSTTTEEAAGHQGGKSGKGGDFLYRWGNPENYHRGDSTDRQLFGQHDVRWIEKGKPGAGNLTVFNNHPPNDDVDWDWSKSRNLDNNYSMIFEINTPIDEVGNYNLENDNSFEPEQPIWFYRAPDTLSFYSSYTSGAQRMQNGNTFINEGAKGRLFEVSPSGNILWEYLKPYRGAIRKPNGDPIGGNPVYGGFRATFIPADHPAFEGRELKPLDPQPVEYKMPPPADEESE